MRNLSICVLTYNQPSLLDSCLKSIDKDDRLECIVIDNASPDPDLTKQIAHAHGWEVRRSEVQRGNIGGQNLCFELTDSKFVLFISDDVIIKNFEFFMTKLVSAADMLPQWGQVMPPITEHSLVRQIYGMDWRWPGYGKSLITDARFEREIRRYGVLQVPIVPSICYLMKRSAWEEVGGFDEELGTSHEDVDMGIRLAQEGYGCYVALTSMIEHKCNGTLRETILNPSQKFQEARLKVIRKHYRGVDRWARLLAVRLVYYLCSHFRKTQ